MYRELSSSRWIELSAVQLHRIIVKGQEILSDELVVLDCASLRLVKYFGAILWRSPHISAANSTRRICALPAVWRKCTICYAIALWANRTCKRRQTWWQPLSGEGGVELTAVELYYGPTEVAPRGYVRYFYPTRDAMLFCILHFPPSVFTLKIIVMWAYY